MNHAPTTIIAVPHTPRKRRVHIETWGCQMNVADSETMLAQLNNLNYEVTSSTDDADLVLLNTCHIREKATHKVLSRLGVLKEIKDQRPHMRIAVAGCVAQAEGKRLIKSAPQIDVLLGPGKLGDLSALLDQNERTGRSAMALGFDRDHPEYAAATAVKPTVSGMNEVSRFVTITQGCDNFCTFCVVPFTRGREISRLPAAIIRECEELVAAGTREITLLGQNVNSYGSDLVKAAALSASAAGSFADLLGAVAQIDGLLRLRFTTSNPHDFSLPLATLFRERPKLGRYIHLPAQSGNDTVLEKMKRKVTRAEYLQRVAWLRSIDPDFAISTDLIVGFPGETEEQFHDTLALVREVRFSFAFSFMYSPRKNTAAARFAEPVDEATKNQRLALLNKVQDEITLAQNLAEIGRQRAVLVTYTSKKEPGICYGRTEHFRLVKVAAAPELCGRIVPTRITAANKTALVAEII